MNYPYCIYCGCTKYLAHHCRAAATSPRFCGLCGDRLHDGICPNNHGLDRKDNPRSIPGPTDQWLRVRHARTAFKVTMITNLTEVSYQYEDRDIPEARPMKVKDLLIQILDGTIILVDPPEPKPATCSLCGGKVGFGVCPCLSVL